MMRRSGGMDDQSIEGHADMGMDREMSRELGYVDLTSKERHVAAHVLPATPRGWRPAEPSPCASKPFVADVLVTDGPASRDSSIPSTYVPPTNHQKSEGD